VAKGTGSQAGSGECMIAAAENHEEDCFLFNAPVLLKKVNHNTLNA